MALRVFGTIGIFLMVFLGTSVGMEVFWKILRVPSGNWVCMSFLISLAAATFLAVLFAKSSGRK